MANTTNLKPTEHLLVYDLVKKAGLDVSDWSNYKKPQHPAANPKYCYDWAFHDDDGTVLCLWYTDMFQKNGIVYQDHNYREISSSPRQWNDTQRKRARKMDLALQKAYRDNLPIRVIVVDGSRREYNEETASKVGYRLLDPEPWHVAFYDDDGNCRIQRGPQERDRNKNIFPQNEHKLTRIAYNSANWQRPTGDASQLESSDTYSSKEKYAHEDWLFRNDWQIEGWRYSFIQGLNKGSDKYVGKLLDVSLYTVEPNLNKRLVATIYELETLSARQAERAIEAFKNNGWYATMCKEVAAVGGDPNSLDSSTMAERFLNIRFRLENVETNNMLLPDSKWLRDRQRYMLYDFDETERGKLEGSAPGRSGTKEISKASKLFRRGTKPTTYTPEHQNMQAALFEELAAEYGKEKVLLEEDYVDVKVETESELIYFEIKTDISPRSVIRQALGQILEYAFYPRESLRQPTQLVIVGRSALDKNDQAYLDHLRQSFNLSLSYRVVKI